mgnify:CR=1 FL=1
MKEKSTRNEVFINMKRIFCILFLISSLMLSAFEITKGKNVRLSDSEMKKNSSLIEGEIRTFFSTENMNKIAQAVLDNQENMDPLDNLTAYLFSSLLGDVAKYSKISIEKVHYVSDNQADVTIKAQVPEIDITKFEQEIRNSFKRKTGVSLEQLENKKLSDAESEKYLKALTSAVREIVKREMQNSKKYNTSSDVYKFLKSGNSWELDY